MPLEVSASSPLTHPTRRVEILDRFNGPLLFDIGGIRLIRGDETIALTPTEWRVLRLLVDHSGQAVPRIQILRAASGDNVIGSVRNLDPHIRRLRKKIEMVPDQPEIIQTIHGIGYRLDPR